MTSELPESILAVCLNRDECAVICPRDVNSQRSFRHDARLRLERRHLAVTNVGSGFGYFTCVSHFSGSKIRFLVGTCLCRSVSSEWPPSSICNVVFRSVIKTLTLNWRFFPPTSKTNERGNALELNEPLRKVSVRIL